MRKLLFILTLSLFSFNVSAQTKVAYCDVYARGGGLNLKITVSYDNQSYEPFGKMNIGEVLNIMAADGWVLDKEIVIPRHPLFSMFTRHKLHLIMKKEYQEGDNPFAGIMNTHQAQDKSNIIEYKGIKATKVALGDKIILVAINGKAGTWYDAVEICKSLGDDWRLPTISEMQVIKHILEDNAYWTCEELNEKRAKYFAYSHNEAFGANKNYSCYIQPIAVVNSEELK